MAKIFKPVGKSKYVLFYTDHTGQRRKKTLAEDRETSERIRNDVLNKVALRKDGLVDERDEKFAAHEGRPLKEHLEDYVRFRRAEGVTESHILGLTMHITTILNAGKFRRISDLSASRAQEVAAELRRTLSINTVNRYIVNAKGFSRWLWRDKRAREYALSLVKTQDPKNDRRHVRRRMTDAEVLAVIIAAENGRRTNSGFTGPDRAMLYRVAHGTRFRAKELRTLTPERFRLDDNPPTITALGCYTKNRQEAVQPIAASLADLLRPWLARKRRGAPVFEGMNGRTAEMLRIDLKAAGVPYENEEGIADFHASRNTYISNLVSSGASVKTCQTLARHADPSLTIGIYAKSSLHDVQGAVEKLPDLTSAAPESAAMEATGTDGRGSGATQNATRHEDQAQCDEPNVLGINGLRQDAGPQRIEPITRCWRSSS